MLMVESPLQLPVHFEPCETTLMQPVQVASLGRFAAKHPAATTGSLVTCDVHVPHNRGG